MLEAEWTCKEMLLHDSTPGLCPNALILNPLKHGTWLDGCWWDLLVSFQPAAWEKCFLKCQRNEAGLSKGFLCHGGSAIRSSFSPCSPAFFSVCQTCPASHSCCCCCFCGFSTVFLFHGENFSWSSQTLCIFPQCVNLLLPPTVVVAIGGFQPV